MLTDVTKSAYAPADALADAELDALTDSAALADYLRAGRADILEQIRCGPARRSGLECARRLTDLMDSVIRRMFTLSCALAGASPARVPVAIVATGGYGRRELAPFSDVDVTFIPQLDGDPLTDRVIRDMFTQVMDICIARCGLEVGYAYRLLTDCGSLDHQTACGLLDARLIVGSDRLFIQFEDAFWSGFNATDFIFAKIAEREKTLCRYGRTPRVVEPHLKEGPGGLRDLHTAVWLVQARNHLVAARVRGERALEALVRDDVITRDELGRLAAAKERLVQVRNLLHASAGSRRDELVITRQEEVARLCGYVDVDARPPAVERFMADLYPTMTLIRHVAESTIDRVGNSRLILGIGLDCRRRRIVPANDALESDGADWLLWASELAQRYGLGIGESIERRAAELVASRPVLRDPPRAADTFKRMLNSSQPVYPILQTMADLGILGWFLPEFGAILNLIPYDPSHDHTVGQHSLLVIKEIEELRCGNDGSEEAIELRRALDQVSEREQLFLAALLHDSGKAAPGRQHSEVSDEIAASVCARLGWTEEATANVRFLVRHHLLMAETSRMRDLNLDETIRDFTSVVSDADRLNMLYLLTYGDTRAVGAGVWSQVKGRFLRDLWRRASAVLTEDEPIGLDATAIARARSRLLKELTLSQLPAQEVAEHVASMPAYYLLNQSLERIALDVGFVRRVRSGEPVVDFADERNASYTELTVCAVDDPTPGLLAKIAGALYATGLQVHSAQVITRITERDRIAIDTLWVDYRGKQLSPGKRSEVTRTLTDVLIGARDVRDIVASSRSKALPSTPTAEPAMAVRSVRNDLSDALTVVEVSGPDQRGALYIASDALSRLGLDVRSARVSIWQGQARAAFYVDGARHLSERDAAAWLARVLPIGSP